MKLTANIYNRIDNLTACARKSYNKFQGKVRELCGTATIPEHCSVYETKGLLFPDYDKVTVDITQKNWQKKLNFNKGNISPEPTEYAFEKFPEINYLIDKPDIPEAKNLFYRTIKSTPMPVVENPPFGIMIDNFAAPSGTIAIEGTLDDTFYTKKLYQCAGVSIVDKEKNLQKLVHFFLYSDENDSLRLFKFLTRGMKEPQITLIPGARAECNKTLEFLSAVFRDYFPETEIKHLHVPEPFNVNNAMIGLNKGEVFCTIENPELITSTNPKSKIIHI